MFDESLRDFFEDFGEVLTSPILSRGVPCLVDAPTAPAFLGRIESQLCKTVFTCISTDVAGITEGYRVTVLGTNYLVRFADPEGSGLTHIGVVEESQTAPTVGDWR